MKPKVVTKEFKKAYRDGRSYRDVVQDEVQRKEAEKTEIGG